MNDPMENKKPQQKAAEPTPHAKVPQTHVDFAFGRENYRLMLIGLALIILGFVLMIGGGSKDPNTFNPEIFSFRRLTLAPILVLAGYVVEIFAIMKKSKDQ
jgi:hypothetical protein